MRDRSYQYLQDATSFGLLSDKNAEKLKGEKLIRIGFSIPAALGNIAFHMEFSYANEAVMSLASFAYRETPCWPDGQYGELPNF